MTKILIIEDDPTLRSAYETTLTLEGFEAVVAEDGEVGWAAARDVGADVILLDMMMPKFSGLEFLRRRAEVASLRATPVIVFSNLDSPDDIDEALALGAAKYVTKANFTPKEMVAAIREVESSKVDRVSQP